MQKRTYSARQALNTIEGVDDARIVSHAFRQKNESLSARIDELLRLVNDHADDTRKREGSKSLLKKTVLVCFGAAAFFASHVLRPGINAQVATNIAIAERHAEGNKHHTETFRALKIKRLSQEKEITEAQELEASLRNALRYDGRSLYSGITDKYIASVIGQARWSSKRLGIPTGFVLSDWLMECGKLDQGSMPNIMDNNLANMGYQGRLNFHLIRYPDLHMFAEAYVDTLERSDVKGLRDYREIVGGMMKADFFVGESADNYYRKVVGVRRILPTALRN